MEWDHPTTQSAGFWGLELVWNPLSKSCKVWAGYAGLQGEAPQQLEADTHSQVKPMAWRYM